MPVSGDGGQDGQSPGTDELHQRVLVRAPIVPAVLGTASEESVRSIGADRGLERDFEDYAR